MRRHPPVLFLAVAIFAPSAAYVPDTLTFTSPDVGQGDSILVLAQSPHQSPPASPQPMAMNAAEEWEN